MAYILDAVAALNRTGAAGVSLDGGNEGSKGDGGNDGETGEHGDDRGRCNEQGRRSKGWLMKLEVSCEKWLLSAGESAVPRTPFMHPLRFVRVDGVCAGGDVKRRNKR